MRELREDTFSENKNDDAHKHVERVLNIVSLFNIPGVTHDAGMLRVLPISLTGATKRWVDRLSPGTVHHPRPLSNLKKSVTSSKKVMKHCTKLRKGTMTCFTIDQLTKSIAIRRNINSRNIDSSSNSKGIAAIASKLDNLGRDIKKLKENVHVIQVGCQLCEGAHLDKECPLNDEVKSVEEVKHVKFRRSSLFNNGAKYCVVPPGYYTRVDNRPPFGEKMPSLEELMSKRLEESTRRRFEMEEWVKKLQENAKINTQNQSAYLINLVTQIKQLTKEFHAKAASEVPNSSVGQCKAIYANDEAPIDNTSSKGTYELHADERMAQEEEDVPSRVMPCQLPSKELNRGNFTLPCTIGSLKFYAMTDLGVSVNVILKSMFEHLNLANLKKTEMLVDMANMTKRAPIGIVENVLVKIDNFLFPLDFVVIDMLNTRNETMILVRPFLATIHAEIDVFNK
nr:hypothetical protein [Tanacetum cinerariifolium]